MVIDRPAPSPSPQVAHIGARVRRVREAQGMSQGDLAERLGKSQAAVSQWESGRRTPAVDDLVAIAGVLDHDVREFLPGAKQPTPVAGLLRAEVAQLDYGSLSTMIESFLAEAERLPRPAERIRIWEEHPIRAAQQLLARAKNVELPIQVDELAATLGALVLPWHFEDALSGLVVELEGGPVIGINDSHASVRQRFTLAHELGHLLLRHGEQFHLDLSSDADIGDPPGYQSKAEREANEFAANLLMPAATLRSEFSQHPGIEHLARRFEVSDLAMRYRLANLGLRARP
jgi:Zn-dependent peptidase ImmA (M78 family)/DNA-binding XRE family transcriptional regulator